MTPLIFNRRYSVLNITTKEAVNMIMTHPVQLNGLSARNNFNDIKATLSLKIREEDIDSDDKKLTTMYIGVGECLSTNYNVINQMLILFKQYADNDSSSNKWWLQHTSGNLNNKLAVTLSNICHRFIKIVKTIPIQFFSYKSLKFYYKVRETLPILIRLTSNISYDIIPTSQECIFAMKSISALYSFALYINPQYENDIIYKLTTDEIKQTQIRHNITRLHDLLSITYTTPSPPKCKKHGNAFQRNTNYIDHSKGKLTMAELDNIYNIKS